MNIPWRKLSIELISLAVICGLVYLGNHQVQTWLGQRAVEQTGLPQTSYQMALEKSAQTGKPVLLEFAAIWCSSCRALDTEVLANTGVRKSIESGYIFSRLEWESEADKAIFEQYGVDGFPVLLIVDANGQVRRKINFTLDPQQFLAQL